MITFYNCYAMSHYRNTTPMKESRIRARTFTIRALILHRPPLQLLSRKGIYRERHTNTHTHIHPYLCPEDAGGEDTQVGIKGPRTRLLVSHLQGGLHGWSHLRLRKVPRTWTWIFLDTGDCLRRYVYTTLIPSGGLPRNIEKSRVA